MTVVTLPPGPGPAPLNMLGWVMRPIPFMEHARRRFGDRFTVDMGPPEGKWIFITQPDEIREVFTAPADVLHPGEGARVLEPVVGRARCCCSTGASTSRSASSCCRPSTASGCGRSSA
jgi:cytochrome P450